MPRRNTTPANGANPAHSTTNGKPTTPGISYAGLTKDQTSEMAAKRQAALEAAQAEADAKIMAEYEALKAENARLKALVEKPSGVNGIYFKVSTGGTVRKDGTISEGGGLSVYGLQRFPMTLFIEQWMRLLDKNVTDALLQFAKDHAGELKLKPAKAAKAS